MARCAKTWPLFVLLSSEPLAAQTPEQAPPPPPMELPQPVPPEQAPSTGEVEAEAEVAPEANGPVAAPLETRAAPAVPPVVGASPSAKAYPPGAEPPAGDLEAHPGSYQHDGFYLRIGLGGGALLFDRSAEVDPPHRAPEFGDSVVRGFTIATEVSIGGMPRPDLVVAGTWLGQVLFGPEVERDDGQPVRLGRGNFTFNLLGATVDYYRDPSRGFHAGGTLGLAYVTGPGASASPFRQLGGIGPGLSGFVGYDLWVLPEWSVGLSGRLNVARIAGEYSESGVTASEGSTLLGFALLASALYH